MDGGYMVVPNMDRGVVDIVSDIKESSIDVLAALKDLFYGSFRVLVDILCLASIWARLIIPYLKPVFSVVYREWLSLPDWHKAVLVLIGVIIGVIFTMWRRGHIQRVQNLVVRTVTFLIDGLATGLLFAITLGFILFTNYALSYERSDTLLSVLEFVLVIVLTSKTLLAAMSIEWNVPRTNGIAGTTRLVKQIFNVTTLWCIIVNIDVVWLLTRKGVQFALMNKYSFKNRTFYFVTGKSYQLNQGSFHGKYEVLSGTVYHFLILCAIMIYLTDSEKHLLQMRRWADTINHGTVTCILGASLPPYPKRLPRGVVHAALRAGTTTKPLQTQEENAFMSILKKLSASFDLTRRALMLDYWLQPYVDVRMLIVSKDLLAMAPAMMLVFLPPRLVKIAHPCTFYLLPVSKALASLHVYELPAAIDYSTYFVCLHISEFLFAQLDQAWPFLLWKSHLRLLFCIGGSLCAKDPIFYLTSAANTTADTIDALMLRTSSDIPKALGPTVSDSGDSPVLRSDHPGGDIGRGQKKKKIPVKLKKRTKKENSTTDIKTEVTPAASAASSVGTYKARVGPKTPVANFASSSKDLTSQDTSLKSNSLEALVRDSPVPDYGTGKVCEAVANVELDEQVQLISQEKGTQIMTTGVSNGGKHSAYTEGGKTCYKIYNDFSEDANKVPEDAFKRKVTEVVDKVDEATSDVAKVPMSSGGADDPVSDEANSDEAISDEVG